MAKSKKPSCPKCPACDTAKHVSATGLTGTTFFCSRCKGTFEPLTEDDGGDYSSRYPDARLLFEESRRQQRRQVR